MTFNDVIQKIMLEAEKGSNKPFMIHRKDDGDWDFAYTQSKNSNTYKWVNDVKERDHYALTYTGKDFSSSSISKIYEKVLVDRIREEYNVERSSGRDSDEIHALTCFFIDNIASFSKPTTDYLTTVKKPLAALKDMCPFDLTTNNENWSYNKTIAADAIEHIEQTVAEHFNFTPNPNISRLSDRRFEDFQNIHSVKIAGKTTVIAENPNEQGVYLLCDIKKDYLFGLDEMLDLFWTDDYLLAMREFTNRIENAVDVLRKEQISTGLPGNVLTHEHCIPNSDTLDWTGKIILIKPEALAPEYRSMAHQLVLCTGGFGAMPKARGNAVFVDDLLTGKPSRYERSDIVGIADLDKLPQWAVDKLMKKNLQNKEMESNTNKSTATTPQTTKIKITVRPKPSLKDKLNSARDTTRETAALNIKPKIHKAIEVT